MNVKLGLARPLLTFWQFLTCSATLYGFFLWINLFILGAGSLLDKKFVFHFVASFCPFLKLQRWILILFLSLGVVLKGLPFTCCLYCTCRD